MAPKAYKQLRFGDWALKLGFMTQDDLKYILSKKNISKQMIGQLCLEEGLIDGEDLAQIMAAQFSYRYVKVDGRIPEELVNMVPLDLMARYKFVPFKKKGDQLTIAMAEPKHLLKLVDELEMLTDLEVNAVVASEQNIKKAIQRVQKSRKIIDATTDGMQLSVVKESDKGDYILSAEKVSTEESPIVKLVDSTILDAINKRASDIHIETTAKGIIIRYRINGMLHQATNPIDAKHQSPIISRIKVMAELDISEKRIPQDGRFKLKVSERFIDFRISILPTIFGEDAVIRILDRENIVGRRGDFRLDGIGFAEYELLRIRRMINAPYGMFLMTGPTGSGKTTTLYGALSEINHKDTKIITIEDPVEYQLEGIVQIPVNEKKGLTFARGLRSILRHDPDKILVGEIRDPETAQIALQSALTGHMVFTTVHANRSFDVINRFTHMGIQPDNLMAALNCIASQRLIRTLCECKTPYTPEEAELMESGLSPKMVKGYEFYTAKGCERCQGTGYRGRKAVVEIMEMDDEMREMFITRSAITQIKQMARESGTIFLRRAALQEVFNGVTTLREANRVTFVEMDD
ncbi:MAG: ATPase, T2SS/T4P/T4SS family [Desulfobacterales bacterium]|nr:ATPase, T2SS/T4P/T4SS family [Desulfobacterales bacterium]